MLPKQVRYQAAPHPDTSDSIAAVGSQQDTAVDHYEDGSRALETERRLLARRSGESAYIALALGWLP